MLIIISFVFITYAILVRALYTGWMKIITDLDVPQTTDLRFVTVLVPFRNEAQHIARVLDAIFTQNYPKELFEVILINDHSTDGSLKVIEDKINATGFSKITIVHVAKLGKKSAITEGVRLAQGKIVLTTDADCEVGRNWIISFNSYFKNDSVKFVFGPVKIVPNGSLFQKMQSIEFASLIGAGAATMSWGSPTMCNGANLAFRKEAFEQVNGYEGNFHVASGDDEFLMRKMNTAFPECIRFNISRASVVSTKAQRTLADFLFQRIRWAAKWRHHRDFKTKLLAVYVFLFHLLVIALPVLTILGYLNLSFVLVLFLVKAFLEFRFLVRVTSWLQIPWHWPSFILLQFLYSLYSVTIGLLANFMQPKWKGRAV
jgi:biofilm PGA synthesis N-glycosyltransferase PgaC